MPSLALRPYRATSVFVFVHVSLAFLLIWVCVYVTEWNGKKTGRMKPNRWSACRSFVSIEHERQSTLEEEMIAFCWLQLHYRWMVDREQKRERKSLVLNKLMSLSKRNALKKRGNWNYNQSSRALEKLWHTPSTTIELAGLWLAFPQIGSDTRTTTYFEQIFVVEKIIGLVWQSAWSGNDHSRWIRVVSIRHFRWSWFLRFLKIINLKL